MNSTVLALLLITSLNALPERPPRPDHPLVLAPSPFQASDQATRLAAKGRLPRERLELRMSERLALADAAR